MKKTVILLPPSEGKTEGGLHPLLSSVHPNTKTLLKRIENFDGEYEKLYGVKGEACQKAIEANRNVLKSPTMPAIERYSGVVFQGLDYPSLQKKQLCKQRVYFVSALFGLIRADERIPNYKLKIDKLDAAKLWLPEIKERLKKLFVIDLLPQSHKKAVAYEQGIAVEFVTIKTGKKVPAGHQGKYIKGRFVRWLLENNIPGTSRFPEFQEDGYIWDGNVFVQKK